MNIDSPARTAPPYRNGAAARFVDSLLERGRVAFPLSELTGGTGLTVIAARRQLARLGSRVRRVAPRQPFYLIVTPEHRLPGAPPPAWWLEAWFRWLKRPWYLALQSAAAEYGSRSQALQVTQVMTDRPRREVVLGRVRVRFFVKGSAASTPTQAIAGAQAVLTASTPEATALDLIRYANRIGGISRAAETLAPFVNQLRRGELARALKIEADTPASQRLGYVLESLGARKLAGTVRASLPRKLARVALDPAASVEAQPDVDERWGVVVNISIQVRP